MDKEFDKFVALAKKAGFENAFTSDADGFEIVFTDEEDMTKKMFKLYKLALKQKKD